MHAPQLLTALFVATLAYSGVVLDRIAVIVGKHVIKSSDINRDLRVTEFLNHERLDLTPTARRKAAERLIDQEAIRQEIVSGQYHRPVESEADALEKQIIDERYGHSEARLRQALTTYGLSEEQLRSELLWQVTVLQFIDQRFRPGVFVSEEEARAYYDQHMVEPRKQNPANSSFEAAQAQVRKLLEGEQINRNLTAWLEDARKRYRIEYKEDAFT